MLIMPTSQMKKLSWSDLLMGHSLACNVFNCGNWILFHAVFIYPSLYSLIKPKHKRIDFGKEEATETSLVFWAGSLSLLDAAPECCILTGESIVVIGNLCNETESRE